jgi:uncharacterized membrane protein
MREILTLLCLLGCGLMAGFFYSFSVTVMRALGQIAPPAGIAAMQSINVVVINPIFLSVFLGTAVACLVVLIASLVRWRLPGAGLFVGGSVLYLVGTFLVTMLFNVPRNNALAAVAAATPEAAAVWQTYLTSWTSWNHVRTLSSLAALLLFALGVRSRG